MFFHRVATCFAAEMRASRALPRQEIPRWQECNRQRVLPVSILEMWTHFPFEVKSLSIISGGEIHARSRHRRPHTFSGCERGRAGGGQASQAEPSERGVGPAVSTEVLRLPGYRFAKAVGNAVILVSCSHNLSQLRIPTMWMDRARCRCIWSWE